MWIFVAFRNLFRNPRRTIAILLTVAIGSGALFAFSGFIRGILEEYRETTIHSHYGNGQINTKGYRDSNFEDPTQHWIKDWSELQLFLLHQEGVEHIFPRASFSALLKTNKSTVSGHGQGVDGQAESEFFNTLNIEEGGPLEDKQGGILLGIGLAKALGVHPGDKVTVIATSAKSLINKDKFVVTGIFHTGNAHFDNGTFRVQLPDAQNLLKTKSIESVSLGLKNLSDWEPVSKAVSERFPNLESTPFDLLDKIYYKHSVDWLEAQFGVVQVIILGIVLLGIFNTVSASILERKQEIGNLRANGESKFQVMRLVFLEGALLSILGGALGLAVTYAVLMGFIDNQLLMPPGPGQTRQFLVTFTFTWPMVLSTMLLNTLTALIASFLAGVKVARMPIAAALRAY
jgi:putative ABC transport system permease protein